ncbi:hypothetical protein GCM10011571_32080 [Marinithermofilum abyssi]|uniref:Uncharacterized protein n=1 Tax=Marinithermofilum abyssi TaxID=1571185 RepID=A0A8J2VL13_9BACL|nr:hypothetical protein GCM10011571_32080 [Marinithermofilum abyssi]
MARMTCKCGEILSTIRSPNEIELIVYTDVEWDEIVNMDIQSPLDIPHLKKRYGSAQDVIVSSFLTVPMIWSTIR